MRDDILLFSGSSHPGLAAAIARELGVAVARSETVRFSNENLMVQIEENVRESDVFVVQTSTSPVHENLFELLIFIDALKRASARRVTAVIPYFPYVRSDKKDRPRISITARLVADLLEAAGADRILTMDLHAAQIQGFFKIPVDHMMAMPLLCEYSRNNLDLAHTVVVATDAGRAKEAARYASRLGVSMAIIDKRRDGDNEQARAAHIVGDVEGKTAFVIDDEIASGGTLVKAIEILHEHGARRIIASATHPVFTGTASARLQGSPVEQVVVTDSIPTTGKEFEKLRVLSVAPIFAAAIARIHDGRSVSELF